VAIVTADFSPGGEILITGGLDGYVIEWDGESGSRRRVLLDPSGRKDGRVEVRRLKHGVRVDPGFRLVRWSECMRGSSILTVRFSPDGSMFAVGAANGAFVLWKTESRGEILSCTRYRDTVDALAISPDNQWLAAGSEQDAIDSLRVWRLEGGMPFELREAFSCDRHIGGVSCLRFSPDSRWLAAGGFTMSGYTGPFLYDVETGKREGSLLYDMTRSLDYSPDGCLVATGDDFGSVKIWDAESRTKLFESRSHKDSVAVVRFSPDERWLASGSRDDTVKVWDVAEREMIAEHLCAGMVRAIRCDSAGGAL
jgi:WD40 repeat protein